MVIKVSQFLFGVVLRFPGDRFGVVREDCFVQFVGGHSVLILVEGLDVFEGAVDELGVDFDAVEGFHVVLEEVVFEFRLVENPVSIQVVALKSQLLGGLQACTSVSVLGVKYSAAETVPTRKSTVRRICVWQPISIYQLSINSALPPPLPNTRDFGRNDQAMRYFQSLFPWESYISGHRSDKLIMNRQGWPNSSVLHLQPAVLNLPPSRYQSPQRITYTNNKTIKYQHRYSHDLHQLPGDRPAPRQHTSQTHLAHLHPHKDKQQEGRLDHSKDKNNHNLQSQPIKLNIPIHFSEFSMAPLTSTRPILHARSPRPTRSSRSRSPRPKSNDAFVSIEVAKDSKYGSARPIGQHTPPQVLNELRVRLQRRLGSQGQKRKGSKLQRPGGQEWRGWQTGQLLDIFSDDNYLMD